jgi:hypothetical protein
MPVTSQGLSFEDGLAKMLGTPPPLSSKSAKRVAAKRQHRKK